MYCVLVPNSTMLHLFTFLNLQLQYVIISSQIQYRQICIYKVSEQWSSTFFSDAHLNISNRRHSW